MAEGGAMGIKKGKRFEIMLNDKDVYIYKMKCWDNHGEKKR